MGKSTVYFTDFRCPVGTSQLDKLKKVCLAAGIKNIDMDGKFVAIKMHFGELGNLAFLRPNYAKAVADLCKAQGGVPFLTDCNTLYPGSRKNALEHLDCANLNGFNTITTGCQILIGDGLRGTDEVEVPVPVSYTHLRAHETRHDLVCRLLLEKKKKKKLQRTSYAVIHTHNKICKIS